MGKLKFRGDASNKIFSINEPTTGEVDVVNETDGVTLAKVDPTTITDAGGVQLASHGSRHGYGQADAIPGGALDYSQLASNTIYFLVPFTPQDCLNQTGLSAASTGVKFTSVVKLLLNARHLKKIRIRASWTASNTDSVTEVRVVGSTSGVIVSVSGNTGTDAEAEATSGWTDGEYIHVEVAVTTASATTTATTDLTYAVVELEYGVS